MKTLHKLFNKITIISILCIFINQGVFVCGDNEHPIDPYTIWGVITYDTGGSPQNININVTNTNNGEVIKCKSEDYDASSGTYSTDISTLKYADGDRISVSIVDKYGNKGDGSGTVDIKPAYTQINIKLKNIKGSDINEKVELDKKPIDNKTNVNPKFSENTDKEIYGDKLGDSSGINATKKLSDEKNEDKKIGNDLDNNDGSTNDDKKLSNKNTEIKKTDESNKSKIIWFALLIIIILIISIIILKK